MITGVLLGALPGMVWSYAESAPPGESGLDQLVAEIAYEGPWQYTLMKRTGTLRFAPSRWARDAEMAQGQRRYKAAFTLTKLGTNAWPAVPALLSLLKNRELSVTVCVADTLASIKAEEHPGWNECSKELAGSREAAAALHYLVMGRDTYGRRYDIRRQKFGLIGLATTGDAAQRAFGDAKEIFRFNPEPDLRALALPVMSRSKNQAASTVPLLKSTLRNREEWPVVRASAASCLADAAPKDEEACQMLVEGLKDEKALVRLACAKALLELGFRTETILPSVEPLLNHQLVSIRIKALQALPAFGVAVSGTKAKVERLLADENVQVREAAKSVLKQLP